MSTSEAKNSHPNILSADFVSHEPRPPSEFDHALHIQLAFDGIVQRFSDRSADERLNPTSISVPVSQ